ncbi:hypothetical protein TrispH2_011537 [Trichoplax sp. H2]|nr:hypothetical protein TrispH2_011537 [Trichoplax sp. H2]|eukprot:RDD36740.1 hypothetical protein TrispH2_011537 [Trichoplax sp. H2]
MFTVPISFSHCLVPLRDLERDFTCKVTKKGLLILIHLDSLAMFIAYNFVYIDDKYGTSRTSESPRLLMIVVISVLFGLRQQKRIYRSSVDMTEFPALHVFLLMIAGSVLLTALCLLCGCYMLNLKKHGKKVMNASLGYEVVGLASLFTVYSIIDHYGTVRRGFNREIPIA